MRNPIEYIPILLLFSACEKEIEIDYRDIEPLYVVNGSISNEGCEVTITKTRNIDNPEISTGVQVEYVSISDNAGSSVPLSYSYDGNYYAEGLTGESGTTYTLNVMIDGVFIESSSTMPGEVKIDEMSMHWEDLMGNDMLHLVVDVKDVRADINYYYYRVLRNGKLYKWNVIKDMDSDSRGYEFDINLMSRNKAEKNDPDDYDSVIFEGDEITVEVRAIDLRTYDYLFSAKLSGQNSSNPINNYNIEDILGYFSAYYTVSESFVFNYKDVKE